MVVTDQTPSFDASCNSPDNKRKSESLKGHLSLRAREFAILHNRGWRLTGAMVALCICPAEDQQTRLGLIVSKKFHRRAVYRNRAKRLIRESFRRLRPFIQPPAWIVVIARPKLKLARFSHVFEEMKSILVESGYLTKDAMNT